MFLYNAIRGCEMAIPETVGTIVSILYLGIKIGIPIILLIVGMLDLGKAVVAQKEDEIKKAQGLLIKKVITAVIIFMLFMLIQFAINLVDKNNASTWTCINALLGNEISENAACPNQYEPMKDNNKLCVEAG